MLLVEMFRVVRAMLAKWTKHWTDEKGQQAPYDLLDAVIRKALDNTTVTIELPGVRAIDIVNCRVRRADLSSLGKPYALLASRSADSPKTADISFIQILLQCFDAFAIQSRQKLLTREVITPIISTMVKVVSQQIDHIRHDKWLDQSALLLVPSPRAKRVERVSQLYKHTIAKVAAESSCRVDANTGWFNRI